MDGFFGRVFWAGFAVGFVGGIAIAFVVSRSVLRRLEAMAHDDPDMGLTAFAYTPDERMPQDAGPLQHAFAAALDALPPTVIDDRRWLVWSHQHGAWWKSGGWGYTGELKDAGRFTARDAADICVKASYAWLRGIAQPGERDVSALPPVVRVLAPQFTPTGMRYADEVRADAEVMQALASQRVQAATAEAVHRKESLGLGADGGDVSA